jgi:excinuclease ABC subunit B
MERAIGETERRRARQMAHNKEHHITPKTIQKAVADIMEGAYAAQKGQPGRYAKVAEETLEYAALSPKQLEKKIKSLEDQMYQHAQNLEFEEAAQIRDQIEHIRKAAFGAEIV